jgi:predicted TIM-barrel fold metal-dependent hydrolase
MAKQGFRVMDSDMHIMEPPDLWQRYTDRGFKDHAPRGLTEGVRDLRMVHPDGTLWGMPPADRQQPGYIPGRNFALDQVRYKPYEEKGWTAPVQLGAMDEEGIDIAILYPTRGLHALAEADMDPGLAGAVARGYNDWLYDFCQTAPSRLIGAGMVSPFNIEDAVSETSRCIKKLGFRAVFLRANIANGRNWHDPYYDPLWSALEELNMPIGFHESASSGVRQVGDHFGANFMLRHLFSHPVELMMAAADMCGSGVMERHPKLRAAFLEGNCSWVPWFLWRLDEHWEMFGDAWGPELKTPPSEYFKRQCFVSVEPDEEPLKYALDYMGNDRIVFSTDYPHVDSKFPKSVEVLLQLPITDEDKRKILWDNCATFYGMAK